jgi:hypothetical protein
MLAVDALCICSDLALLLVINRKIKLGQQYTVKRWVYD